MARRKQAAKETSKARSDTRGREPGRHGTEAGAIAGEVAGAVIGSGAGPVGTVAGMIIGGVAGALTGKVLEDEQRRAEANDAALDQIIGVIGGDMGAPIPVTAGESESASESGGERPPAAVRAMSVTDNSPPSAAPRPFVNDVLELIELRQSSRGPFDPGRAISAEHLGQILEAARWAPTAHNMQNFEVIVVDDRDVLDALSNVRTETSRTFIEENYAQLSFSEGELKKKKTGLLASAFPPSWWTPGIAARIDEEHAHSILGAPIQLSAALIVVIFDPRKRAPASEGDVLGMMSLGCVMQNMWLAAQALGIGYQVQSVFGAEGVEPQIKRILAIPEPLRVAFAVRLGFPQSPQKYLRVRRDVGDFAHDNRFEKPWRRSTGR